MEKLIGSVALLAPAGAMALYLVSLYRRIEDRSASLVVTDLFVFPFCFMLSTLVSMGGAFAIGPSVRTPTIVFWMALLVGWVGLHALRWKPFLRLASVSGFIGMSSILGFLAYVHVVRDADKVFRSSVEAARRSACRSNLGEVGKAMSVYATDNDDRLPSANWTDAIAKYAEASHFRCPTNEAAVAYTMNAEAMGVSTFEAAPLLVVAFDGNGGENQTSAGPAKLRWAHGQGTLALVLTINGNAQIVMPYTFYNYVWDRKTALSPEWESWLKSFERR